MGLAEKYTFPEEKRDKIKKTSDSADCFRNDNISFREYLAAKTETVAFYLADLDRYAGGTPQVSAVWYIRADATNWQNDPQYVMDVEDGMLRIRLYVTGQMRLKVYNDKTGNWYGAECISQACTVPYDTDDHTNIVLGQGTYILTFDPETERITLQKE